MIDSGLITSQQLLEAKAKGLSEQRPVLEVLIDSELLSEDTLFRVTREIFPTSSFRQGDLPLLEEETARLVPLEFASSRGVLPLGSGEGRIELAMIDPSDFHTREEVEFLTGLKVTPILCSPQSIRSRIKELARVNETVEDVLADALEDVPQEDKKDTPDQPNHDLEEQSNSSLVRLVNMILRDAVRSRASDIHIEPQEKFVDVRYRIDGYLKSVLQIPSHLHQRLISRIKVLARLDIAENRKFQDGRVKVVIEGRTVDLRVSVIPAYYGEKPVIRLLDPQNACFELDKIGMHQDELNLFAESINRPQGVILVTGPTGSGKTTTLYAALQHIKCETKNIITIEDPVEYLIDGINQLQLNRVKDITFANGLRSILRQDPDVLLVGEIRDKETAEIAFRASLTGHLVFSTLHTNGSASTVIRLLDIGLEPYLISSSINMIVSQRLVRLICPHCREKYRPDAALVDKFQVYLKRFRRKAFIRGKGCRHCDGIGYYGRTSLFEMMTVDDTIRQLINSKASEREIFRQARAAGMKPLALAGVEKVVAGLTTLEEVAKVAEVCEEVPAKKKTDPLTFFYPDSRSRRIVQDVFQKNFGLGKANL